MVPEWIYLLYEHLTTTYTPASSGTLGETQIVESTQAYFQEMADMWEGIYPYAEGTGSTPASADPLNPFSAAAWPQLKNEESWKALGTLTAFSDYEFAKKYMSVRTASATVLFNMNYVPSYPAMITDPSPDGLPFIGVIESIVHTITPNYVSTQLNMTYVHTLEELGRYYIPPLQPYMNYALGFTQHPTIVNNQPAKTIADQFYNQVFGVGAIAPEHIYDFVNMQVYDGGQQGFVTDMAQGYRPGITIAQAQNLYGVTFITVEMQQSAGTKYSSVNVYKNPSPPKVLYELTESEHIAYNISQPGCQPPCQVPDATTPPSVL